MMAHTPRSPRPGPEAAPRPTSPHLASLSSGGRSLDAPINTRLSAQFGHDFSSVRIHTDSRAGDHADALGANAYALGSDVVFGPGKYNPGSSDTDRLLAHELTHVVQQARGGPGDPARASRRGDASEREADALAADVAAGKNVEVRAAPGAAVARDDMPDVPDTPSVREKDKPGGPTDWGDKSFSLSWDSVWPPKNLLSPKSGSLDIGQGDPFTFNRPGPSGGPDLTPPAMLPPPTIADPNADKCLPGDPGPTPIPMGPGFQYTPPANNGGLLGQPYDPSKPFGDPSTWAQPSGVAPGPF